ncbi:HNH endonuclease [Streptomyces fimicarius]|uniref:HNH endonuclease n=1 Tax=Streptomyces griseus TaxID=1911 RepID=UPI0033FEC087
MTRNTAEGHPLGTLAARRCFNKAMRTKGIPAKVCGSCHAVKGLDAFPCNKASPDGRYRACIPCSRTLTADFRIANPTYNTDYRADNPAYREGRRAYDAARRARPDFVDATSVERSARRRARKAEATVEPFTEAELFNHWAALEMWSCQYCGAPWEEIEHVLPLSRRGAHALWNLVPACADCNGSKYTKTGTEYGAEIAPAFFTTLRRLSGRVSA